MKFLKWLFNFKSRHYKDEQRYECYGWLGRIMTLVMLLAFCGATIGLEIWSIKLYDNNFVLGLFSTLLFIAVAGTTFEYCEAYAVIAIRMAIFGAIAKTADRIDKKIEQKKIENGEIDASDITPTTDETKKSFKYRWLDILIGILCFALGIALLIAIFFVIDAYKF